MISGDFYPICIDCECRFLCPLILIEKGMVARYIARRNCIVLNENNEVNLEFDRNPPCIEKVSFSMKTVHFADTSYFEKFVDRMKGEGAELHNV